MGKTGPFPLPVNVTDAMSSLGYLNNWPFQILHKPTAWVAAKEDIPFPKTESWKFWLVHDLSSLISSKRFIRVPRNSFESIYLYSWQAQTSPFCCGIIHLHSTWISCVIPILNLGKMRKKRSFATGNPKFPGRHNLSPWDAEFSFFFSLWACQDNKKTPTFRRAERSTLYSSSIACNKDSHSSRAVCIQRGILWSLV